MSVFADASSLPSDRHSPALKDENELSEEELRRLYDDDEIERFLGLFADFVSEVTLLNPSKDDFPATAVLGQDESDAPSQHSADEWTSIESNQVPTPAPSPADAHCVSEHIAYKYLLPMLPPLRPRPERFTMGRLRLTVQRLYLIAQPAYFTTFSSLTALATWKNRNRSALYCAVYWVLWYRNLLMPAFFFCVLHSLMRRKLFPYPTLSELQERRREAARSELLGERLQSRLGASSSSGLMEVWRLFRVFNKPNRKQKQAGAKDKGKGSEKESKRTSAGPTSRLSEKPQELAGLDEASISDDPNESEEERDLKRALLNALNDIADMHERAKNIILWRRPSSSRIYAALLVFLIFFTAYLSTAYIVKLASFILGFLYWHVMPIIVALPSPDRSRLPPMFENAPTDAEHAMDLIAQRIARGEDIRPSTRKLQKRSKESTKSTTTLVGVERASDASTLGSSEEGTAISESDSAALKSTAGRPGEVDWRKWAERAANTKSWVVQGKRMVAKSEDGEEEAEPHTFLAHHKASPGMLTLTRTTLFFTPITSMRSKICIALNDVCGVKKIGIGAVPGLSIKWQRRRGLESDSIGEPEIVEEKFRWVGGRDEVFARLVGWGGRRWLKVLAATLGSKSSFKKLTRRSIQTADIPQLCNLISHPSEPLALRLSSNLMVGVARVYKIKHEIFVTDVSNCFIHLKKAVQEIHSLGALSEAQLQMGQPSVRPDALTLTADPTIAVAFELDAFDSNWGDISGFATRRERKTDDDDGEFTLNKSKSKSKSKASLVLSETGRAGLHTLDEHHEYLLSTSFEGNGSFVAGIDPSSSQIGPGMYFGSYPFDDNIFGTGDHLDLGLGDIGDDLARELGEGWGADSQNFAADAPMDVDPRLDFQIEGDVEMGLDAALDCLNDADHPAGGEKGMAKAHRGRKRPFADSDKENMPPTSIQGSVVSPLSILTSRTRTPAFPVNDQAAMPELVEGEIVEGAPAPRKIKKVRLLLDARTELTDEELKAAREKYVEGQCAIRLDMERKRLDKESSKVLEDLIWGVPEGITAPALTNFWTEIYKIQVESRSGAIHLGDDESHTNHQRRVQGSIPIDNDHRVQNDPADAFDFANGYALMDMGGDYDFGAMQGDYNALVNFDDISRIRSSEEPEHGRNAATHVSPHLGFDAEALNPSSGTQRSAFFPWDNAAGTSSSAGAGFVPFGDKGSDRLSLNNADVRILQSRSRSGSRRGSFSIVPSQTGSMVGLNVGFSPGHGSGNDFQFDVTKDEVAGQETQEAENNIVTLERTSFNFLEYCKMQVQGLPGNQSTLDFTDLVPSATSSRRVAAAAFHHCLVLATKDLIIVRQDEAYGLLTIKIN